MTSDEKLMQAIQSVEDAEQMTHGALCHWLIFISDDYPPESIQCAVLMEAAKRISPETLAELGDE